MEGNARPVGRPRTTPVPEGYYSDDAVAARRAYHAAYKARNADTLKTYYKAWRAAHPEKHMQYNREWAARDRARRAAAAATPPPRLPEEQPLPQELQDSLLPLEVQPYVGREFVPV